MFTDDKCFYLTFLVKGGGYNPVNKKIKKHELVPVFSNERVCIKPCGAGKGSRNKVFYLFVVLLMYTYFRGRLGNSNYYSSTKSRI